MNMNESAFPVQQHVDANGNIHICAQLGMTKLEHFSLEIFKHINSTGNQIESTPGRAAERAVNKALILLDAIYRRSAR